MRMKKGKEGMRERERECCGEIEKMGKGKKGAGHDGTEWIPLALLSLNLYVAHYEACMEEPFNREIARSNPE